MKTNILIKFLLFFFISSPALAYLDPGSGSSLMAIIIGFFVTIGVAIKTFWYKIKSFFSFSKKGKADQD